MGCPKGSKKGANRALYDYKRFATRAANDLGYSEEVENRIKEAKTEAEIARIMVSARREKMKKEDEKHD